MRSKKPPRSRGSIEQLEHALQGNGLEAVRKRALGRRIDKTELHRTLNAHSKIVSRGELRGQVQDWRDAGSSIVLANGAFDLLHAGHVRYLKAAKALGGRLIVAINSDESVRALKGEGRPIIPEQDRAEIVAALASVDAVVIFPELDVRAIIREVRPDIHAKGTDYTADSVPERDAVLECGGRVAIVGDPKDHSSSDIIRSRFSQRKR